jgi:cytochrome c oxidase cbb3-type subunit 2
MNNGLFIFLGILVTLTLSWAATVLSPQKQEGLGQLMPYYDINEDKSFPRPMSGLAEQGQKVYQDLGCVYCHTQQVRRSGYGNDVGAGSRNWGERQSVARDYIQQDRVQLGSLRVGPDLTNVGSRELSEEWHFRHFYNAQLEVAGSNMPSYSFLYEEKKILGEPSSNALSLEGESAPQEGFEVIPTHRAEALVAYMLSLKTPYSLPEAEEAEETSDE